MGDPLLVAIDSPQSAAFELVVEGAQAQQADLMVSFRNDSHGHLRRAPLLQPGLPAYHSGDPGGFCGGPCRSRAHRQRQRDQDAPVIVMVDSARPAHGPAAGAGIGGEDART